MKKKKTGIPLDPHKTWYFCEGPEEGVEEHVTRKVDRVHCHAIERQCHYYPGHND